MKPTMRVIELKKQGCLLSGSYTPAGSISVRGLSNDENLIWDNNGFDDEDMDY